MKKNDLLEMQFENISYTSSCGKKKKILADVSGILLAGQLTAILGPSGSGKTTLLNVLSGYKQSNGGEILINDRPRQKWTNFKKHSAYIRQFDVFFNYITVYEYMQFFSKLKGQCIEGNYTIDHLLETLNLQEQKRTRTCFLSGGERRRLSIALELISNPKIIFFDEPTSGLDYMSATQCIQLIKSLCKFNGRTICVTIHQPNSKIFDEFDKILVLVKGQTLYHGDKNRMMVYFDELNFKIPTFFNPADFLLEISSTNDNDKIDQLLENWKKIQFDEIKQLKLNNKSLIERKWSGKNKDTNKNCSNKCRRSCLVESESINRALLSDTSNSYNYFDNLVGNDLAGSNQTDNSADYSNNEKLKDKEPNLIEPINFDKASHDKEHSNKKRENVMINNLNKMDNTEEENSLINNLNKIDNIEEEYSLINDLNDAEYIEIDKLDHKNLFGAIDSNNNAKSDKNSEFINLMDIINDNFNLDGAIELTDKFYKQLKARYPFLEYIKQGLSNLYILTQRGALNNVRDRFLVVTKIISTVLIGLIISSIYYKIGCDGSRVIDNLGFLFFSLLFVLFLTLMPTVIIFPYEKVAVMKEYLNNWFSLRIYFLSKILVDLPFQIIIPLIYLSIGYYMSDQIRQTSRFIKLLTIFELSSFISESVGMLIGIVAPSANVAVFIAPIIGIPIILFSGFFIKTNSIPTYWRWFSSLSFTRYSWEGIVLSIYGDNRADFECSSNCTFQNGQQVLEYLSIDESFMGVDGFRIYANMIILVGFLISVKILAYISMQFLVHRQVHK